MGSVGSRCRSNFDVIIAEVGEDGGNFIVEAEFLGKSIGDECMVRGGFDGLSTVGIAPEIP